jgi:DNA polymerase-2
MMNALFGVLGASSCRFFSPAIANAITGFGQQTLAWTRDGFEKEGVTVLYGDTDSVFVQLGGPDSDEARRARAEALRERVEGWLCERIRSEYGVEPRLELELERIFDRLLLPRVRGGRGGSKKRYAGWCAGRLEVVGLEAVRRDWPEIAGHLQRGLLTRVFRDEDALPFAKQLVAALRAGELDDELVYVKRIRKASLDRYTATTPPHVQAARKAREREGIEVGSVVRYLMTRDGPEPVFPGRPLPSGIDHAHYVERVLRPVADAILIHTDQSFDEVLEQPRQMSLL